MFVDCRLSSIHEIDLCQFLPMTFRIVYVFVHVVAKCPCIVDEYQCIVTKLCYIVTMCHCIVDEYQCIFTKLRYVRRKVVTKCRCIVFRVPFLGVLLLCPNSPRI